MSDDKFNQAVLKIFKLTHLDQLQWTKKKPPRSVTEGTDSTFPFYFETSYQGRRLGLFSERFRRAPLGAGASAAALAAALGISGDESAWGERASLWLLDNDGEFAFAFPDSRVVRDLLETVRYKTSGIDEFLDDLLNTEPSKA